MTTNLRGICGIAIHLGHNVDGEDQLLVLWTNIVSWVNKSTLKVSFIAIIGKDSGMLRGASVCIADSATQSKDKLHEIEVS